MPASRPTLSRALLRTDLHASAFRAGGPDLVGFEVELTPLAVVANRPDLDATRAGAEALWADLAGPAEAEGVTWRGGTLTREPGGQVEFSGPAVASPEAAARLAQGAVRRLGARARRR